MSIPMKLIERAKNGDESAIEAVLEGLSGLNAVMAAVYSESREVEADLRQEGDIAIYKALSGYNSSQGTSFTTYVYYAIRSAHVNFMRDENKQRKIAIEARNEPLSESNELEDYSGLKRAISRLDPIEQDIIIKSFGLEGVQATQAAIGEIWGLTQGRVSQLKNEAIEKLKTSLGAANEA